MSILERAREHLVGVVIVSFALGGGLAIIVIGVPQLWTTEAAGWGSAVSAFAAAVVALFLAGSDRRRQRKARSEAGRLAFIALWPRLHRAQAQVSKITFALNSSSLAAVESDRHALEATISALEAELAAIGASAAALDSGNALRLTGAVSLAGFVARQARRFTEPGTLTARAQLWKSPCRKSWVKDSRVATQMLMEIARESERAANEATGRVEPNYNDAN